MNTSRLRRLSLTALTGLAVTGLTAGPAMAATGGAHSGTFCQTFTVLSSGNGIVSADRWVQCGQTDPVPAPTTLQRQNPTTGAWTTLATGDGAAWYACQGTAARKYRAKEAPTKIRTFACS